RLAEPASRVLHGDSGQADVLADLGDLRRRGRHRRRLAGARVAHRHQPRVHRAQGVRRRGPGRLRVDPRRARRRPHHRADRAVLRRLPAAGIQGRCRVRRAAPRARGPAARHVRGRRPEEGLSRMRFAFKTSYAQDLGLFRDRVQRNAYIALFLALLVLPRLVPEYLGDLSLVFIYGLCGVSLMVLAGYTGLVSLGHSAFLGIGAYAHVYFAQDLGVPWVVAVALAAAVAAQSMGVNLAVYKTMAFAYSAGLMGVAGALFAHKIGFLAPDIFSVLLSIQFLLMVAVGGLGSLHGAVYGAVFVAMLPVVISQARDAVPAWVGGVAAVLGKDAREAVFLA